MHGIIIPPPRMVAVSARPRIGRLEVIRRDFAEGASLAEMADAFGPDLPPEFRAVGIAVIDDGGPIEPRHWHLVRPRAGHCVAFIPMPGKAGEIVGLLANLAVLFAAGTVAYTLPQIGATLVGALGLVGVRAVHSFLYGGDGKLAPAAKKGANQTPPKQLGGAGFSKNALESYAQVPTVLGIRRVPASFLAPPWVEVDDNSAIGTAITGLAGRHEIREPLLSGSPPELIDNNIREGDASDLDPTLYTTVIWQQQGSEISRHNMDIDTTSDERSILAHSPSTTDMARYDYPKPVYFRMGRRRFPDRAKLDFLFDQGLYRVDASGKAGVAIQLSFVKAGATTIYLPEVHPVLNFKTPIRMKLIVEFGPDPGGLTAPSSAHPWRNAFANSDAQIDIGSSAHSYYGTADISTHVGVSGEATCTIYCDPASIALDGSWQLKLLVGSGYMDSKLSHTNGQYQFIVLGSPVLFDPKWYTHFGSDLTIEDQAKIQSHLTLEFFTREYDTEAVVADGLATYEIRTKNKTISQVSFLAGRYVDKRWDGSAWVAEPHVSNNPAELAYDIMTNASPALNARPLAASLVDGDELGEWADYCSVNGLTCNAYIESGSVEDALAICFEAGHAYLKRSQKWGVYIEKSRAGETPVMVFSPRNSRGFMVEKSFEHKPHALRVTFDDEKDDYQTNPDFVVYAPGYDELTATDYESVHYLGITIEWQARARADLDLGIIYYRDRLNSLETDARYLVAGRGSLVGINHFVLSEAHGFAAIREVIRQEVGGVTKITGLLLDTYLDMQPSTTGIAISTNAGEVVAAQSGQAARVRELVFSTPLADDPEIEAGCTITSGTVTNKYIRCIVDDIKPGANGTARLMLVDEAPEIFGVETGNDLYASPDLYAETDLYNLNN